MIQTLRCDKCIFWDITEGRGDYGDSRENRNEVGLCTKARSYWAMSEWKDIGDDYIRRLKPEFSHYQMFVQDGLAILLTKPEFFCAHFEQKGLKNAPSK